MPHPLQRRLARLFPHGNETSWLDCRNGRFQAGITLPVAIVGLDFLAAAQTSNLSLPAAVLILDMDEGPAMEDVFRSGADGLLCSEALPWADIAALARQCRKWHYPLIADCRNARPQSIEKFFSSGIHAALLTAEQAPCAPFRRSISRLIPGTFF